MTDRDPGMDTLLVMDGEVFTLDATGQLWVKFEATRCTVTTERPHGLRYSLTLHDETGARL
ncbi:hypothetical protein BZM27_53140, partial [Paraburkholderia steynii]